MHHLALEVSDIEGALREISQSGIPLIDETPRKGVENTRIAFLHPRGTGRVLLELVQS
jgi:methylmalonyl-CoA/ethylmalonyl-CoA epimerase